VDKAKKLLRGEAIVNSTLKAVTRGEAPWGNAGETEKTPASVQPGLVMLFDDMEEKLRCNG